MNIIVEENALKKHKPWFNHPENPYRIELILKALKIHDLARYSSVITHTYIEEETWKILKRIHYKGYLGYLVRMSKKAPCEIDPDTYMTKDTLDLALETIDLAYNTARNIRDREKIFLIVRPPGHHVGLGGKAMGSYTQGFCILNNVASAVIGFKDRGLSRVAVLDLDLHHGNGTQEIFYRENTVLHIDIHRDPRDFYPFTGYIDDLGYGKGYGYSVNLVLEPGTGDDSYIEVFNIAWELLRQYNPEAIVVSMGFDGYMDDGLSDLMITEYTYYMIGGVLRKTDVPLLIVLEGGYSKGLLNALPAFIKALIGERIDFKIKESISSSYVRKANLDNAIRVKEKILSIWGFK
ncbi:MAG: acetylpolyamine amidohydrolase [Desulfurococcales archaeon ex4484_58]|nr:MAG: acetylpolyamine amidohydrolase [Desulfurococcales archaeon ex4484_58]